MALTAVQCVADCRDAVTGPHRPLSGLTGAGLPIMGPVQQKNLWYPSCRHCLSHSLCSSVHPSFNRKRGCTHNAEEGGATTKSITVCMYAWGRHLLKKHGCEGGNLEDKGGADGGEEGAHAVDNGISGMNGFQHFGVGVRLHLVLPLRALAAHVEDTHHWTGQRLAQPPRLVHLAGALRAWPCPTPPACSSSTPLNTRLA